MLVVTQLNVRDMVSLGKSCWNLYCRLQPSILKDNIQHQNSNLLHLAARDNDYARAELLLLYGANANTFLHGKPPLMRAIQHGSIDVLGLLLSHQNMNIWMLNREGESASTYAVKYGTCAGKERLAKPRLDITIRDEHDRTVPSGHLHRSHWISSVAVDSARWSES
ncbi:hypothetical protein PMG11_11208 [Penicillium brasilianum]|uniref:Uncharacterized protein n=1 Tax=Penicillium brasilianum TaxID=104259 RepID=A0A0F7U389_PENBI|nr:hypothetical protein PMG11_11208 [Penicillium brasilianum]